MTTSISMYGEVKYASGVGFLNLHPLAQIIEGLEVSSKSATLYPTSDRTIDFDLDPSSDEVNYVHLYTNGIVDVEMYDGDEDVVVKLKCKGHQLLTLAPGSGIVGRIRLNNTSTKYTVEATVFYGSVVNDNVPKFFDR